jgi:hypothetical protein
MPQAVQQKEMVHDAGAAASSFSALQTVVKHNRSFELRMLKATDESPAIECFRHFLYATATSRRRANCTPEFALWHSVLNLTKPTDTISAN